jgi:hypothetical protein
MSSNQKAKKISSTGVRKIERERKMEIVLVVKESKQNRFR